MIVVRHQVEQRRPVLRHVLTGGQEKGGTIGGKGTEEVAERGDREGGTRRGTQGDTIRLL